MAKACTFLPKASCAGRTNAIYDMDSAYQNFFKEHAGYPKFKSKYDNHKSYTSGIAENARAWYYEKKESAEYGICTCIKYNHL